VTAAAALVAAALAGLAASAARRPVALMARPQLRMETNRKRFMRGILSCSF